MMSAVMKNSKVMIKGEIEVRGILLEDEYIFETNNFVASGVMFTGLFYILRSNKFFCTFRLCSSQRIFIFTNLYDYEQITE
jgi:hypothetical protein